MEMSACLGRVMKAESLAIWPLGMLRRHIAGCHVAWAQRMAQHMEFV
jgi:hypothetical protein